MLKRTTTSAFILFFLLPCISAFAQQPSRVTIKGVIKDTLSNETAAAVLMLLNPSDSTLQNYSQANDKGEFTFNNVRNIPYLLKVSHISYLPLQMKISPSQTAVNNLGIIPIKMIAKELFEVVIKTAKAPLYIRGDTIEYDATTFKVPTGSSVEDLLRRLPGIQVDAEGNIQTQGKDVRKVYVDGKTFFGDDPKSATKNIEAGSVSKVQVFDEKSEQSQLTGVNDGSKEKAMNIELKDEYKKGSFGKLTAAGGTLGRWAGRGNFNRFNNKYQLSFIGYGNNINETGVNWEDYSEFKGQNAFNNYDNGDFGFSSGSSRYYSYSDDGGPVSYFDGRGFTKNFGGGTNYNFDNKKTKFNASYFYNYSKLNFDQFSFKQTFLSDSSFFNHDTTNHTDVKGNHSIATRIEQKIDSNNVIIAKANFRYSTSRKYDMLNNCFSSNENIPLNELSMNNGNDGNAWRLTSAAIYRHRFKKQGRSFAVSGGFNKNQGDVSEDLYSINSFSSANTYSKQIHQLNSNNNNSQQIKSSLLYTEPLSKKFFYEIFYNFNSTDNRVNKQVTNPLAGNERIDSLSIYYTNKVMINRLGNDLRYSYNGLNIMLGLAGQYLQMNGKYSTDKNMPLLVNPVNKYYKSLSPKFNLSWEFPNDLNLNLDYVYNIEEPSFDYLQPVPNVSNPSYRILGNPDLLPERSHDANLGLYYSNPSSFASIGVNCSYTHCDNKIIYNQTIRWVDSVGFVTTSKPGNNPGYQSISGYLWSNLPIIKTKLSCDISGNSSYSTSGAYINDVLNDTRNLRYGLTLRLNITPGQKLIIGLSGKVNFNDIEYNISKEQNQKIQNHRVDASIKWQFVKKFFLESNFYYDYYHNNRVGMDKSLPILNASVRTLIGKKNHFEIRLAAFDVFNKRQYIQQYASQNYVIRTTANTLARYYMLSVSYNIKGFEATIKKSRFW